MKRRILTLTLVTLLSIANTRAQDKTLTNPKFTLKASYGFGVRLNATADGISSDMKQFYDEVKTGGTFDLAAHYTFLKGRLGVGLKYNNFTSKGNTAFANGKHSITYFGPSFIANSPEGKIGQAQVGISIGYIEWKEDYTRNAADIKNLHGDNVGLDVHAGYHFRINKYLYIGPELNLSIGAITEARGERFDGTKIYQKMNDQPEGLTRADFLISAKFKI